MMDGDVLRLLETTFSGYPSALQSSSLPSHVQTSETHSAAIRGAGYMDTNSGGTHEQVINSPAVSSCSGWCTTEGARRSSMLEGEGSSTSGGSYSEDSAIDESSNLSPQLMSCTGVDVVGVSESDSQKGRKRGRKGKDPPAPTHTHLGGMRRCRVPLSAEIREVLEVAWTSRIIQPGVDGRREKERIACVTGMSYSKVHEWFRNRRKKEKLVVLRKKGLAPPTKKWSPLTRQQSGSSSSSDLSLRLESANLETCGHCAVSAAATSEIPPVN